MTDDRTREDEELMLPWNRPDWSQPGQLRGGTAAEWQVAIKEEVEEEGEDVYPAGVVEWALRGLTTDAEEAGHEEVTLGDRISEVRDSLGELDEDEASEVFDEAILCLVTAAANRLPEEDVEPAVEAELDEEPEECCSREERDG